MANIISTQFVSCWWYSVLLLVLVLRDLSPSKLSYNIRCHNPVVLVCLDPSLFQSAVLVYFLYWQHFLSCSGVPVGKMNYMVIPIKGLVCNIWLIWKFILQYIVYLKFSCLSDEGGFVWIVDDGRAKRILGQDLLQSPSNSWLPLALYSPKLFSLLAYLNFDVRWPTPVLFL